MSEIGKTQAASQDEDVKIGETVAVFANKLYFTPLPLGGKITFAEQFKVAGEDVVKPRLAVFLQHQDVFALRQLLESGTENIKISTTPAAEKEADG